MCLDDTGFYLYMILIYVFCYFLYTVHIKELFGQITVSRLATNVFGMY